MNDEANHDGPCGPDPITGGQRVRSKTVLRRLGAAHRRRAGDERGVVIVLAALLLVVMLGAAALAIDLGSFYKAQRQAQSAADAGALAGASALSATGPSAATTAASTMANTNYPGGSVTVSQPTTAQVKVVINAVTPSFFGGFLGLIGQTPITQAKISASAVASEAPPSTACTTPGVGCYAIFARDQTCTSASTPFTGGGGIHITGGVHSNGSMNIGGGGSRYGQVSYGTGCPFLPASYQQNNNTFTPVDSQTTPNPAPEAPTTTWPEDFNVDFPSCAPGSCTGPCDNGAGTCASTLRTPSWCDKASTAASWAIDTYTAPFTLVSGTIYCGVGTGATVDPGNPTSWNGALQASGGGPSMAVTLVAGSISFGGGTTLKACGYNPSGYTSSTCGGDPTPSTLNYPVAYATKGNIDDGSGGAVFTGDMFAPGGTIIIGGGVNVTSFLEGNDVNMSSGGITGDGPDSTGTSSTGTGTTALVQ